MLFENWAKVESVYGMPKRSRQTLLAACDAARANGQASYGDAVIFKVTAENGTRPRAIRVIGYPEERELQVLCYAKLACQVGGEKRWWKVYFGLDHKTKPHQPFIDPSFLPNAHVDPFLAGLNLEVRAEVTPRRLFIVSSANPYHYQAAGFEMDDLAEAEQILAKPRFVAVQRERVKIEGNGSKPLYMELVADIVGKNQLLSIGSALIGHAGEIQELYTE